VLRGVRQETRAGQFGLLGFGKALSSVLYVIKQASLGKDAPQECR